MMLNQQDTRQTDKPSLKRTFRQISKGRSESYFTPQSIIRRVYSEGAVLLASSCTILLQLAHPFIAAGVDEHSHFQSEILKRLYRTLLFLQNLIFEDAQQVEQALQEFHEIHEHVKGQLKEHSGYFPAGTPYSGKDPQAKLWVYATLVDTALKVYERFITPLTAEERRNYYSDSLRLAKMMDIPDNIIPQTQKDFENYMHNMLTGNVLAVSATTVRLARAVLYPKVGFVPSISAGLLRLVTAAFLPERFRQAYGLKWGPVRQFAFRCLNFLIHILRPLVPAWMWQNPLLKGRLTYFLIWGHKNLFKR